MRDVRIETERLVIRELRDDDWRALHAVESLPEINRYQAYDAHTEQASRDLIARAQREAACEPRALYELAVTRRGDDRLLGGRVTHAPGGLDGAHVLEMDLGSPAMAATSTTAARHRGSGRTRRSTRPTPCTRSRPT